MGSEILAIIFGVLASLFGIGYLSQKKRANGLEEMVLDAEEKKREAEIDSIIRAESSKPIDELVRNANARWKRRNRSDDEP